MHLGGGTPALLTLAEVAAIRARLGAHAPLAADAEVSIELDPRSVEPGFLAGLAEQGFNRVSFGVQDLDREVQKAIGRVQPRELTERVVAEARQAGFASVNLDLIYGLPLQTRASWADTVRGVLELDPDRVALFNFALVPHMKPHQKLMPLERVPGVDERLSIFLDAVDAFEAAGYRFLGLDHFARPRDELARAFDAGRLHRNFQGYTARDGLEVLAFGASSITQVEGGFAQNVREPEAYEAAIRGLGFGREGGLALERGLATSADDRLRRAVIDGIMCNQRVDFAAVEARFGVDFESTFLGFRDALAPMVADGLVELEPRELRVTRAGRLILRNVAMVFDAYLEAGQPAGYSRTL